MVHDGGVVKIYNFWLTEKGEEYQITETTEKAIPVKWTAPEALVPAGERDRRREGELRKKKYSRIEKDKKNET